MMSDDEVECSMWEFEAPGSSHSSKHKFQGDSFRVFLVTFRMLLVTLGVMLVTLRVLLVTLGVLLVTLGVFLVTLGVFFVLLRLRSCCCFTSYDLRALKGDNLDSSGCEGNVVGDFFVWERRLNPSHGEYFGMSHFQVVYLVSVSSNHHTVVL